VVFVFSVALSQVRGGRQVRLRGMDRGLYNGVNITPQLGDWFFVVVVNRGRYLGEHFVTNFEEFDLLFLGIASCTLLDV